MKQRGFTLVELIIAMMIMAILAGSMTLSSSTGRQTAKREAERLAAKLGSITIKANREHRTFTLKFNTNDNAKSFDINWDVAGRDTETIIASSGCSYSPISGDNKKKISKFQYKPANFPYGASVFIRNDEPSGHFHVKVTGADANDSYVFISGDKT